LTEVDPALQWLNIDAKYSPGMTPARTIIAPPAPGPASLHALS
jgi:hypothetical protein